VRCEDGVGPPASIRFAGSRYGNPAPGNAANPMTGSGMQQARDLRAEETVEVVRNHADGTGFRGWLLGTEARSNARGSGRSVAAPDTRLRVAGSVEGRSAPGSGSRRKPRSGPHRRTNPTRGGRSSTRGSSESSVGERRPEGPHVAGSSAREGQCRSGAVGTPRRPARQRARSGREQEGQHLLRPRRGHLPVVRFGRRCVRALKVT
jgi:hypothetical protein